MGAVVTGRPVESAWLLRRGGRDSPRKDSLQAQSRRVQKICQLLIKKITISITAQHFSVDQSTSKLSASYFYFFYYFYFFRMMRTRRPSLFLMSCTCNSVVSVLPFNSVSLRLRGRLLMHLWPGQMIAWMPVQGGCWPLPRWRERKQRSRTKEGRNTQECYLCETVKVLPFLTPLARLCAHKHLIVYI